MKRIVRWSPKQAIEGKGRTDWGRVDALTDEDIDRAIAEDRDAAPVLDNTFWSKAQVVVPEAK